MRIFYWESYHSAFKEWKQGDKAIIELPTRAGDAIMHNLLVKLLEEKMIAVRQAHTSPEGKAILASLVSLPSDAGEEFLAIAGGSLHRRCRFKAITVKPVFSLDDKFLSTDDGTFALVYGRRVKAASDELIKICSKEIFLHLREGLPVSDLLLILFASNSARK